MNKTSRNQLRSIIVQCRTLLERAVSDLLQGDFGIHSTGLIEDAARMKHLSVEDRQYREQILIHLKHIQSFDPTQKGTVIQLAREVSFTHLNRLCAYKMMEKRGLIREAVSRGLKSRGFLFYLADHQGDEKLWSGGQQELAYKHFLDWLGATLSEEIGVLFSPQDLANRLFPPFRVLDQVLSLINTPDLEDIWVEDEAIGWVYQYFTPKDLRDQARKESAAPRNSYELAFRNQFFTPRYVVEFLTDNTLGRTWYEMRKGTTALIERCRYFVRRPNEIFLHPGETAPAETEKAENLSKEELFRQPVYIPHRQKKDPREILVLDPACGSGHFLLYCFDLLQMIYEEAYADEDLGPRLRSDFPGAEDFRRRIPAIILEHNLHGIDIDLRATQIAGLALWLRAQRAWQDMGVKHKDRPRIQRSHIVCAEPMPGEAELLDEFSSELQPRLLGQLVRVVFEKMKLAGEAGSLLRIEDEISEPIAHAKQEWERLSEPEQLTLFDKAKHIQPSFFDVRSVTDAQFWDDAEEKVVKALREYASRAANGEGLLRRLFADDALQGFAFVDLCRKRFDVVLMNPPFGEATKLSRIYIERAFPRTKNDVYAAFVECGLHRLGTHGMLGAITSRTGFFLSSFQKWREEILLKEAMPTVFADLGSGVLDTAMVETAAYCLEAGSEMKVSVFFRILIDEDKAAAMRKAISSLCAGHLFEQLTYTVTPSSFSHIPTSPFAYWGSERIRRLFTELPAFGDEGRAIKQGLATADDFRFVRTWWEPSPMKVVTGTTDVKAEEFRQQTFSNKQWIPFAKGGAYSPFYADLHLVVNWLRDGEEIKNSLNAEGKVRSNVWMLRDTSLNFFFRPGLTWPLRTNGLSFRAMPAGCIFGHKGPAAFIPNSTPHSLFATAALMNSRAFYILVQLLVARTSLAQSFEVGLVQSIPLPSFSKPAETELSVLASSGVKLKCVINNSYETSHVFVVPALLQTVGVTLNDRLAHWKVRVEEATQQFATLQHNIDDIAFHLYDISGDDRQATEIPPNSEPSAISDDTNDYEDETGNEQPTVDHRALTADLISHAVGCTFGRWDARFATGERSAPELPDPFAPLPVCAPGALQGEDGLPLTETPPAYPLRVDWDGILVDDPNHEDDIVRLVRDVFELIWKDHAEAIEHEACGLLGVRELRDYFRKPAAGGFWTDHLKRYSKSRRKAPIYWLLQSEKKSYAVWLYYHRLDKDLLYKALLNYVEPKLRLEENQLTQLRQHRASVGAAGREAKQVEKQIDRKESLMSEVYDFRDKLKRVAELGLEPDLNDGVVLNIAPLWELVPWSEAKKYWQELLAGKYEWSSIGKQLRERGIVKA